jgi:hypothetical protein
MSAQASEYQDLQDELRGATARAIERQAEIVELDQEGTSEEQEREAQTDAEAAALEPVGEMTLTLSTGEVVFIRSPKVLGWARAMTRLQRAIKPLVMGMSLVKQLDKQFLASEEGQVYLLGAIMEAIYADADAEKTLDALFMTADALLGRPDGWMAGQELEDAMAILTAFIRVVKLDRLAHFFGQARAALQNAARRRGR